MTWRVSHLRRFGSSFYPPVSSIALPFVNEPSAIYLAAAIDERKRMLIAPEPVLSRLRELGLLSVATMRPALDHGVGWLNVTGMEQRFPPLRWKDMSLHSAELHAFCIETFRIVAEPALARQSRPLHVKQASIFPLKRPSNGHP